MSATGTQGTSIAVLAPYLPYGIEVQHRDGSANEKLIGLCYNATELVNVEWHDKPGKNYWYGSKYCLPVLYGFDALPSVLVETPWGLTPASIVLARMISSMQFMPENVKVERASIWAQDYASGSFKCILHADTITRANLMCAVAEWLRSKHFAVGLEPHQYIQKS